MQRCNSILMTATLGAACMSAWAQPAELGDPLAGLERLRQYESMRSSSSDPNWQDGNGDCRGIAPGDTLALAELDGPGMISHIWFTIAHPSPGYPRLLTLRMYWDGEEHPSVECPIGDFFVIGHGVDQPFWSIPITVTSDGRARNCYWPMPFRKSARITVTNEAERQCDALFWYIDWRKHEELHADTAYFHAAYRQEFPAAMGRNYLLADIEGRGHYVGTAYSVYHSSHGWFGEGDDFFFIDGEKEPRLRGTGTEDYFCDAWGFRQLDGPFYGIPLWEGYGTGDRGSAYRFHLTDPVAFRKSLRVEIEHKGSQNFPNGEGSGFIERDDLLSSVAYWYQTEPHKPWPALPNGPDRLPVTESVLVEGESLLDVAKPSDRSPLELQGVGGASGGQHLWYRPAGPGQSLEVTFDLPKAITADLRVLMVHSFDYGTYEAFLDGKSLGVWDLLSGTPISKEHELGTVTLAAGEHTLRFENRGKNDESKGYLLGFDAIVSREAVYSRPAEVDLRTIQAPRAPAYVRDKR